jgi:hypothetical protein
MADEIYETHYQKLMGKFGSHANIENREKAERLAAMKPDDGRRKRGSAKNREHQLNVMVTTTTRDLLHALREKLAERDGRKWSQPDVIEEAIKALAASHNIGEAK